MREVILRILSAEAEAGRLVAGAAARARVLISEAKEKAGQLLETSAAQASLEAGQVYSAALEEAGREKAARLAAAAAEIEKSSLQFEKTRRAAADRVVRAVLGDR